MRIVIEPDGSLLVPMRATAPATVVDGVTLRAALIGDGQRRVTPTDPDYAELRAAADRDASLPG